MAASTQLVEAPARQVVERGRKTLETLLRQTGSAGARALQTSTNEVTFLLEAARLAIDSLSSTAAVAEHGLGRARLLGLARQAELRKAAEPCLGTGQVCALLGVTRETVRKKVDRKQLLALPKGGDRVFPAFQFNNGAVIPGLAEVLAALQTESPFVALSFLLSRSRFLGNKTAIEALQSGDHEAVLTEAREFLQHGG